MQAQLNDGSARLVWAGAGFETGGIPNWTARGETAVTSPASRLLPSANVIEERPKRRRTIVVLLGCEPVHAWEEDKMLHRLPMLAALAICFVGGYSMMNLFPRLENGPVASALDPMDTGAQEEQKWPFPSIRSV